jgi:hypothetical protein
VPIRLNGRSPVNLKTLSNQLLNDYQNEKEKCEEKSGAERDYFSFLVEPEENKKWQLPISPENY